MANASPGEQPMPLTEPRTVRWTKDEYHQLAEMGWFDNRRVELLDGEIFEMPFPKIPHVVSLDVTADALPSAFGNGYWISRQAPLDLTLTSEPIPDLFVVPGKPRDYSAHPTTALLVVEISDTTLSHDRNRKASLYAAARIQDYWIVNLVDHQLEVYRVPAPDPSQPYGWSYSQRTILLPGTTVSPLVLPQAQIAVADLLP
jgi:Uma2 family endonuclease